MQQEVIEFRNWGLVEQESNFSFIRRKQLGMTQRTKPLNS